MSDWSFPNQATPTGSKAYYTVRFSPVAQQDRLALVFAWRQELLHIEAKARDPGVARLKLDWWREELERVRAGQSRHPLGQALEGLIDGDTDLAPWRSMLDAIEDDIRKLQPQTEQDLVRQCQRFGGGFATLLADVGQQPGDTDIAGLGVYAELVERLRDAGHRLIQQQVIFPTAWLERQGLRKSQLAELDQTAWNRLWQEHAMPILETLRPGQGHPTSAALRWAAQWRGVHKELAAGTNPLRERVSLSPLRRLWLARFGRP